MPNPIVEITHCRHIGFVLPCLMAVALCSCSEQGGFVLPSDYPADGAALQSALNATSWVLEDSVDIILSQTLRFEAKENILVVERDQRSRSSLTTLDFNMVSGDRYMYSRRVKKGLVYVVGDMEIVPGHAGVHRLRLKAEGRQIYTFSGAQCAMQDAFHSGRPLPGVATSWDALRAAGKTQASDWQDDVHFSLESIATNSWADSTALGGRLTLYRSTSYDRADSTNLSSFVARYTFNPNLPCHP